MSLVPVRDPIVGWLEIKTGKRAKMESSTRNSRTTHKIVAAHFRGESPEISLWPLSRDDKNVCLAVCFEQEKQNYFAAVNTDTSRIQVEQRKDHSELNNKFLFRWVYPQTHTWNNLCSVAEPNKYLSVSGNVLTLSTSQETLFRFKCNKNKEQNECMLCSSLFRTPAQC